MPISVNIKDLIKIKYVNNSAYINDRASPSRKNKLITLTYKNAMGQIINENAFIEEYSLSRIENYLNLAYSKNVSNMVKEHISLDNKDHIPIYCPIKFEMLILTT